ncbi:MULTISPECIES: glycosyltransferase [Nostocales]|uniref:Glycosyltransferase family 4 protein n=4 Tax=Nostocales TaxID=1161 RepID=A0A8S9SZB4_9CYAN|nr:glycosyltransferase [Tolypothrix bouteillei]KAF3884672.1 glycosyltransferase family 4 protein [Tolypothrix bouteillei VB521301]
MRSSQLRKLYIFFSGYLSFEPDSAHEIHDVLCANAAASLGYDSVLVYLDRKNKSFNPAAWIYPFQPKQPDATFVEFYDVGENLKVAPLPIPWFTEQLARRWNNTITLISKYYFPFHILSQTKIVHTRDWNFVRMAVRNKVPTIYERHYFQENQFEPEIVRSPYFQIAITQSEPIRQSLIECGMPSEKVIWLHNGSDQAFFIRQSDAAEVWRRELLNGGRKYLVVYSGALYRFKGVELLIDAAKELPEIQFAITGGKESQVQAYQKLARDKQVENVKFLGWILPRKRLVSLFQAADILAHPHLSGKEANFTNPVKFFQYMASGTPITVTEIPPLIEFKDSSLVACWCEPDNPHTFAQSIRSTLEKYPRKLEGYADNINFARQYSWENRTTRILNYVNESFRPSRYIY